MGDRSREMGCSPLRHQFVTNDTPHSRLLPLECSQRKRSVLHQTAVESSRRNTSSVEWYTRNLSRSFGMRGGGDSCYNLRPAPCAVAFDTLPACRTEKPNISERGFGSATDYSWKLDPSNPSRAPGRRIYPERSHPGSTPQLLESSPAIASPLQSAAVRGSEGEVFRPRFVHLFLSFYRVHFANTTRVTPTQVHFGVCTGQPLAFLGSYLLFERGDNAP